MCDGYFMIPRPRDAGKGESVSRIRARTIWFQSGAHSAAVDLERLRPVETTYQLKLNRSRANYLHTLLRIFVA